MIRCNTALWAPGSILPVMTVLSGTFSLTQKAAVTLQLRIAAGDPSVSSADCSIRGAAVALRMKNSVFHSGQNVAGMYRCTDGWIRLGPSPAKLANWLRQPGIRRTRRVVENKSITVMNTVVRPNGLKYVRNATHGLISPTARGFAAGFI